MSVKADPCSQPSLMHPDQAIPLLLEQVSPVSDTEVVLLPHALGRVLAEDLASCIDLPPSTTPPWTVTPSVLST